MRWHASVFRVLGCALLSFVFSGCAWFNREAPSSPESTPAPSAYTTGLAPGLNQGYALLYDLMGDEQNVSKLLIIKRERSKLHELIVKISDRAGVAHKQLESFAAADPRMNLKVMGLPKAETDARESISKAKAKKLIGGKGKEFEVQLLLAQNEALTYATHLALVSANKELHLERGKYLRDLARELTALQEETVAMLSANYVWEKDK